MFKNRKLICKSFHIYLTKWRSIRCPNSLITSTWLHSDWQLMKTLADRWTVNYKTKNLFQQSNFLFPFSLFLRLKLEKNTLCVKSNVKWETCQRAYRATLQLWKFCLINASWQRPGENVNSKKLMLPVEFERRSFASFRLARR